MSAIPIPHFHEPDVLCPERVSVERIRKKKRMYLFMITYFLIGVIFREVFSTPRLL